MLRVRRQLFAREFLPHMTYQAVTTNGERVTVSGPHRLYPSGLPYYRVVSEPRYVFAGHITSLQPAARYSRLS
ncbi:hypothetical protein ONR57_06970 [Hoyosella sp. YIM 151337]|uniref:hypothetical protein n=1 Tax=Hoyosella sp. YIM 151337 TaxID=2992742 RepID=UPI00223558C0|nr:hypothetical protein [Hoyosella sp. YIM 151337]MCW4353035.1 hypothetical protein [Hoyosella sp. YIM 151337]